MSNEKTLKSCAFCKQSSSFHMCVTSAMVPFDLRDFIGGMSLFNNTRALFQSLQLPFADKFPTNFLVSFVIFVLLVYRIERYELMDELFASGTSFQNMNSDCLIVCRSHKPLTTWCALERLHPTFTCCRFGCGTFFYFFRFYKNLDETLVS